MLTKKVYAFCLSYDKTSLHCKIFWRAIHSARIFRWFLYAGFGILARISGWTLTVFDCWLAWWNLLGFSWLLAEFSLGFFAPGDWETAHEECCSDLWLICPHEQVVWGFHPTCGRFCQFLVNPPRSGSFPPLHWATLPPPATRPQWYICIYVSSLPGALHCNCTQDIDIFILLSGMPCHSPSKANQLKCKRSIFQDEQIQRIQRRRY